MLRVGLTGGIASGKSAVAALLAGKGAVVIDADLLARDVVADGTPGLAAITSEFGSGVLAPDGSLDRAAMARVVFADPAARRGLEAIVHPLVRAAAAVLETAAAAADPDAVVVHVIPLLVETGQGRSFDVVVVVDVDPQVQRERLMAQRGMTRTEADQRIAAQATRADRLAIADEVVDNSGSLAELDRSVDDLWGRLRARV